MNEQIKELSKEAWRQIDVSKIRGRHVAYTKIFAELIVAECAEIAKHNVMNISTYGDAEFVDQQIKTHFGVTE